MQKTIVLSLTVAVLLRCAYATENPLDKLIKIRDSFTERVEEEDVGRIEKLPSEDTEDEFHNVRQGGRRLTSEEEAFNREAVRMEQLAERRRNRLFPDLVQNHDTLVQLDPKDMPRSTPSPRRFIANEKAESIQQTNFQGMDIEGALMQNFPRRRHYNWTTCEEFGRDSKNFVQDDIINIEWRPFFFWSTYARYEHNEALVHLLQWAPKQKISQYFVKFYDYLDKKLDWGEPKLILSQRLGEALLILADRRGLYYYIPDYVDDHHMAERKRLNKTFPVYTLHFKIIDPYLGIMYCNSTEHVAFAMARDGYLPKTKKEKRAQAKRFNITGRGGFTSRRADILRRRQEINQEIKDADTFLDEQAKNPYLKRTRGRKRQRYEAQSEELSKGRII